MIKVTALYPNTEASKFDIEYYCKRHMPMVRDLLGTALKRIEVEQGVTDGNPESQASHVAAGHMYFESLEAFKDAFAPHAQEIRGDISNYTDIQPQILISEIVL